MSRKNHGIKFSTQFMETLHGEGENFPALSTSKHLNWEISKEITSGSKQKITFQNFTKAGFRNVLFATKFSSYLFAVKYTLYLNRTAEDW